VCKYLIEDGKSASINEANTGGTPLNWATENNRNNKKTAVIAYLECKGATYSGGDTGAYSSSESSESDDWEDTWECIREEERLQMGADQADRQTEAHHERCKNP